jgi:hypothetical protein
MLSIQHPVLVTIIVELAIKLDFAEPIAVGVSVTIGQPDPDTFPVCVYKPSAHYHPDDLEHPNAVSFADTDAEPNPNTVLNRFSESVAVADANRFALRHRLGEPNTVANPHTNGVSDEFIKWYNESDAVFEPVGYSDAQPKPNAFTDADFLPDADWQSGAHPEPDTVAQSDAKQFPDTVGQPDAVSQPVNDPKSNSEPNTNAESVADVVAYAVPITISHLQHDA